MNNTIKAKIEIFNDARKLYFSGNYTQKEISTLTGVPLRTLYNWINEGRWEQLRNKANQAPAFVLENFIDQLIEMQNKIAAREPGSRLPTAAESEVQARLLKTIINIRDYPGHILRTLSETMAPVSDIVLSEDEGLINSEEIAKNS